MVDSPPRPLTRLNNRLADAERLMEIHEELTGTGPGRRRQADVLNRSAVVLAVAAWEGFVEDLLIDSVRRAAKRIRDAQELPETVRDALLAWMHQTYQMDRCNRTTKDAMWRLTDSRWRTEYVTWAVDRLRRFDTPNYANTTKIYKELLGLPDISEGWGAGRWPASIYVSKLGDLLKLRHEIAHGTIGEEAVRKSRAKGAISLVRSLAKWSTATVVAHRRSFNIRPPGRRVHPKLPAI